MEKAKQLFRKNKKVLIPSAVGLVLILAAVIAALILWPAWAGGQNQQESAAQEITLEQLKPFEEQSLLAGVQDYTVGKGETLDWDALLSTDGDIVKSVDVDDSEVDYSTEGDYEITYTVVFDGEKLRHFLEENKSTAAFDANGDQVVVTAVATVTVADEQTDEEAQGSSSESVTSETGEEAQPDEGGTSSPDAGETGQSSTPARIAAAHPSRRLRRRTAAVAETRVRTSMSGWIMWYGLQWRTSQPARKR